MISSLNTRIDHVRCLSIVSRSLLVVLYEFDRSWCLQCAQIRVSWVCLIKCEVIVYTLCSESLVQKKPKSLEIHVDIFFKPMFFAFFLKFIIRYARFNNNQNKNSLWLPESRRGFLLAISARSSMWYYEYVGTGGEGKESDDVWRHEEKVWNIRG